MGYHIYYIIYKPLYSIFHEWDLICDSLIYYRAYGTGGTAGAVAPTEFRAWVQAISSAPTNFDPHNIC
jgi:hypothetical protein